MKVWIKADALAGDDGEERPSMLRVNFQGRPQQFFANPTKEQRLRFMIEKKGGSDPLTDWVMYFSEPEWVEVAQGSSLFLLSRLGSRQLEEVVRAIGKDRVRMEPCP